MRQILSIAALVAVVAFVGQSVSADDAKKGKAACPVAGKPANPNQTVAYKGGTVSFCCGGCKAKSLKTLPSLLQKQIYNLFQPVKPSKSNVPLLANRLTLLSL